MMVCAYRCLDFTGRMLSLGLQIDGRRILDDALHRHLNELIETVQLLTHQALLVEVRIDDDPAGLLPDLVRDLLMVLLLLLVRLDCEWGG